MGQSRFDGHNTSWASFLDNYPEDNLEADQYTDPNKGKFEVKPTNWFLS